MAISPNISPRKIAFSQNPMVLMLETNNANCEFINIKLTIANIDGTGEIQIEQQLEPDSSGQVMIDMSEALHAAMDTETWPVPDLNAPDIVKVNSRCRKYWYLAEEIENGTGNGQTFEILSSDPNYCIQGGLSHQVYPDSSFWSTYMSGLAPSFPFLTWRPIYARTEMEKPEFLYLFSLHEPNAIAKLKVKITYTNNSETTIYLFPATLLDAFNMYVIPAGYKSLGLDIYDTPTVPKTIKSWTVQLVENSLGTPLSAETLFNLNRKYMGDNKRMLFFYNSLGGFDSFSFYGEFIVEQQLRTQQIIKYLNPITYSRSSSSKDVSKRLESMYFKGSSGYQSRGTREYLRELGLSPRVYEIQMDANNRYYLTPIEVISTKVPIDNGESSPQDVMIEYVHQFDNRNYSREFIYS